MSHPGQLKLVAKQNIIMPGRNGRSNLGSRIIPKGTAFLYSSRTKYYVCRMDNQVVCSVSPQYVKKVNIFE